MILSGDVMAASHLIPSASGVSVDPIFTIGCVETSEWLPPGAAQPPPLLTGQPPQGTSAPQPQE